MFEEAKSCHQELLSLTYNLFDCPLYSCGYATIGSTYYALGNIEYAILYLKLALERNGLDSISKTETILLLNQAYLTQLQIIEKEITHTSIELNVSNMLIYKHFSSMSNIVNLLRIKNRMAEANALEDKQIAALVESGFTLGHKAGATDKAVQLVTNLYRANRYKKCIEIAHMTVTIVEEIPQKQELLILLWEFIFYSHFFAGNISNAIDSAEVLINYIRQRNKTDIHADLFCTCCLFVMVGHRNFNCIYDAVPLSMAYIYNNFPTLPRMDYFDYLLDISHKTTQSSSTDLILPLSYIHQVQQYVEQAWWSLLKTMLHNFITVTIRSMLQCVFRAVLVLLYLFQVWKFLCIPIFIMYLFRYCLLNVLTKPLYFCRRVLKYFITQFTCYPLY